MLETSEVVAFVGSADLQLARVFYEQALGLRLIEHNDFACMFDANASRDCRVLAISRNPSLLVRHGHAVQQLICEIADQSSCLTRPVRIDPRDLAPLSGRI